ncbi:hypothetical protein C0J52_12417 [Blattella germanica]|nr:hypothetical protein C0J52_12417 [Blattella germanica]
MSKSSKDSVSELIEDNIRSRVNLSIIDVFYGNEGSPNTSRVTHNGRHSMTYAISETSRRKENMDISLSTVELPRDTKNPSQIKQNENPEKIPCIEAEIIDANQLETENVERKLTEAGRLKTRKNSLYNSTIASQGKQNKKLVEVSRHVSGFNTDTTSEDTNNYFNSDITSEKTKHIDLVHEHQKVGCIVADAEKQKLYESPNLKQYHQRLQFLEKVREKLKLLVSKPTTSSNKVVSDTKIESYSIPSKKCIRREQMIIKSFKNLKSRMSESKSELKKVTDVVESNHKVCELRIPDAVKTLVGTKINDQESEEIKLKPSIADNKNDRDNIDEPTTETLWETSNTQTRTPSQHDFTVSTPNLYLSQLNTNVENKFESACNTKHAHERNRETSEIEKHLHRYPHAKRYKEEYVDKYLNQEILNYKKCKSSGRKYAVGERLLKIRELTSKLDTFHERMNARHMNAVQRLNKIKKTFSIDNIQDILGQAFNKMEEFTHTIITDNKSHKLNTEGGREVNVTEKSEISHPIQEKCMDVNTHKRIFDKTLVTQNMINTTQNIGKSKGIDVAKLHSFNLTQESQNKTKGKEKQSAEIVEIKENSEEIKHFTSLNLSSGTENLIKESGGVTVQNLLQKLAKKQFKDYRRESLKKLQSDMLSAWSKMNNENTSGSEILEMGNYIKDKNRNIYNREKANFKTDIQTECYISSHEDYKSVKENEGRPKAKSFQNKNLSNNESKDRRKSFDSTKFMKTTQSGKLFFESSSLNTMVPLRMDAKQMFTPSKEKYASKGKTPIVKF